MALAYPQTPIKWLWTLQNERPIAPSCPKPRDPVAQASGLLFRDALDKALRERKRAETVYGKAATNAMNEKFRKRNKTRQQVVSPVSPGKKIDKVVEKVKEVDREFRNEDYFRSRFLILRDMVTDWVEALEFNGFYIEVEGQIDASFDILGSCCGDYKRFCGDKGDLMDVIEAYIWHSALLSFRAPDAEDTHGINLADPSTTHEQREMWHTVRSLDFRLGESLFQLDVMNTVETIEPSISDFLPPILTQSPPPQSPKRLLGAIGIFIMHMLKQKTYMFMEEIDIDELGKHEFFATYMEDVVEGDEDGGVGIERVVTLQVAPLFGSTSGKLWDEHRLIVKSQVRTDVKKKVELSVEERAKDIIKTIERLRLKKKSKKVSKRMPTPLDPKAPKHPDPDVERKAQEIIDQFDAYSSSEEEEEDEVDSDVETRAEEIIANLEQFRLKKTSQKPPRTKTPLDPTAPKHPNPNIESRAQEIIDQLDANQSEGEDDSDDSSESHSDSASNKTDDT